MRSRLLCCGECLFPLVFLLILSSTTQMRMLAEGRKTTQKPPPLAIKQGMEETSEIALIGSRPPRCFRRCISCSRCEPVQVPVAPQHKNGAARRVSVGITTREGEDSSNYKPMSWKCKCGDSIFNP